MTGFGHFSLIRSEQSVSVSLIRDVAVIRRCLFFKFALLTYITLISVLLCADMSGNCASSFYLGLL